MIFSGRLCVIDKPTCKYLLNVHPSLREQQCEECPDHKTRIEKTDVDERLYSLLFIDLLKAGGFPFSPNDLSMEQWLGLGVISQERANAALGRGSWPIGL